MTQLNILHAEDDKSIRETVAALLSHHATACEITLDLASVHSFADFKTIAFEPWDAILLDLTFADSHPDETLAWLSNHHRRCAAVLVVTGSERNEDLEKAFAAGALRFILKKEMNEKPRHLLLNIYESVLTRRAIEKHYGTPQTQ